MLHDPVVRKMFGWRPGQHTSDDKLIEAILRAQNMSTNTQGDFHWAIALADSGQLIGVVSITQLNIFHSSPKLEIFLDEHYRNSPEAYGLQAAGEVVRWSFEDFVPSWAQQEGVPGTGYRVGKITAFILWENEVVLDQMRKHCPPWTEDSEVRDGNGRAYYQFHLTRKNYEYHKAQEKASQVLNRIIERMSDD